MFERLKSLKTFAASNIMKLRNQAYIAKRRRLQYARVIEPRITHSHITS